MKSFGGKLYKSNVARLRPWRGRERTELEYGSGLVESMVDTEERKSEFVKAVKVKRLGIRKQLD